MKGIDKLKYELHDTIKGAIKKVDSITELKNELAKQGIDTYFKFKGSTTEIQGVSFGKGKYKFKGSEIDRSLSYGKITQAIQQNVQQRESEKILHKEFVNNLKAPIQSRRQQQNTGGKSFIIISNRVVHGE
ncbi:MAG: hypothetical protein V4592_04130 [Bacteroidota bacterium]